jgi:ABC-type Fe3+-citrate transport system substrate-binding protein
MNKISNVLFIVLLMLVTSACSSNSNTFKTQSNAMLDQVIAWSGALKTLR